MARTYTRIFRCDFVDRQILIRESYGDDQWWVVGYFEPSEAVLSKVFCERRPTKVIVDEIGDAVWVRSAILAAYETAWKDVDVAKILVHSWAMREKVEAIQRESDRERGSHAASFMRRHLGLEQGGEESALLSYYESEFRFSRAKEIEDALIAGRVEEAERDFGSLGEDAKTWARWMTDAQHFSRS